MIPSSKTWLGPSKIAS